MAARKKASSEVDAKDDEKDPQVPVSEQKLLAMASGGICAFPGCGRSLTLDGVVTGHIAHIVGRSRQGPRGNVELTPEVRSRASNLVYLCYDHHKLVDTKWRVYSVQVLRQIKEDHETSILAARQSGAKSTGPRPKVHERLQSTLLPLTHMPARVFSAPCTVPRGGRVSDFIKYDEVKKGVLLPYDLNDGLLYAFYDLRESSGPFRDAVGAKETEVSDVRDFAASVEGRRRLVGLLNRGLRKLLYPKNMEFDREHNRMFFRIETLGEDRSLSYRTKTRRSQERGVVYQPRFRDTSVGKGYWFHMAVNLSFHFVAREQWVLSIRPERHLTRDGVVPLPENRVGPKVTRLKAKLYNDKYLDEIAFWRDVLSDGRPDVVLDFGSQSCIIKPEPLEYDVDWPGVASDKPIQLGSHRERDLFDFARFKEAVGEEDDFAYE